ncbi:MAG: hypothetical protein RO257_15400 [Candidatus Kapabacteria bacterium]|nr:hypothetical protein [Candidatus Kapabacteria bacterium]
MISNKEAAQKAIEYLENFYDETKNILLEEVELTDDNKFWLITLSYDSKLPMSALDIAVGKNNRSYKIFEVSTTKGEVKSMKIRKI